MVAIGEGRLERWRLLNEEMGVYVKEDLEGFVDL